jgi:hypothetical protein
MNVFADRIACDSPETILTIESQWIEKPCDRSLLNVATTLCRPATQPPRPELRTLRSADERPGMRSAREGPEFGDGCDKATAISPFNPRPTGEKPKKNEGR